MIPEDVMKEIEEKALSAEACGTNDQNGDLVQDQWAYDRYKAGAIFGYSIAQQKQGRDLWITFRNGYGVYSVSGIKVEVDKSFGYVVHVKEVLE